MLVRAQGSASYRAVDIKAHRTQDDDALAGVEAAWSALAAPSPEVSPKFTLIVPPRTPWHDYEQLLCALMTSAT